MLLLLVCHDTFNAEEQLFIIQWVEINKINDKCINWSSLIWAITNEFGKEFSENRVKNFWYAKGKNLIVNIPSKDEYEDIISPMDALCKAAEYMYKLDFLN